MIACASFALTAPRAKARIREQNPLRLATNRSVHKKAAIECQRLA